MTRSQSGKAKHAGSKLYRILFTKLPLGRIWEKPRPLSFTVLVLFAAFCVLVFVSVHYLGFIEGVLFALIFSGISLMIMLDSIRTAKKRKSGFRIKGFHRDE
ncbi:MAG: hypothetical protein N0C81_19030 [Candidatus Thiodiazotropha lotti]|nr:hypothetical protein [Candidatus Thiodiazotropha lotti]MCW4197315.1 hypothetical protein [Candidatus Thiodiazotropha lotti]